MSVPNQTPYIIYNANGLTTVFPFEFYVISASDIQVTFDGVEITTGYSVSGVGNVSGGDVVFVTPPAAGTVVMIERVVPTYRLTDYQDNGDLLADTVNKDFDRLWMAIQRSFIFLNRTLRVPEITGVNVLPPASLRANKLLAFNAAGQPITVLPQSGSASDVLIELAKPTGAGLVGTSDGKTVQEALESATSNYALINRKLLGAANKKLRAGESVSIVCVGDSMTIGHDTTSPDVIPGINGNPSTIAPVQYPGRLQSRLNAMTGATVNVINRGYSGDTAKTSYNRWGTNPGSDVAHIMLGINDSWGAHGATFEEYQEYIELIIRRYLDWGCGVVMHTCTALYHNNANPPSTYFSQYVRSISSEYGCPVFESEGVLQYCLPSVVYSDNTHFNKSGYAKYGDALASFIMAGGWVGQQRYVSGYTSTQPGRSSEGIGFFSKNVALNSSSGSYVFNNAVAGMPSDNGLISFSFFLDSEFADIHLVGDLSGGVIISLSSPLQNYNGDFPYNTFQLKREYNKKIAETSEYKTAVRVFASGGKSYAGSLVGRGWKTIYVMTDGTRETTSYLNYLVIEPSSPHVSNQVADSTYSGAYAHAAIDEVVIYKKPYYGRSDVSSTTPPAVPLGSIKIPIPSALLGFIAGGAYFDSDTVRLTIKTVGSSNVSVVANGITEMILYRSGANAFSFSVVHKTSENCIVPLSISVSSEGYDGSAPQEGLPNGARNGFLNIEFNDSVTAYFSLEFRSARKANADQTWLC